VYENQGFRWERNVLAIQFHLEITPSIVEDWLADAVCRHDLATVRQNDLGLIRAQTSEFASHLEARAMQIFANFLKGIPGTSNNY
jgi:GMP synthase-like glutamine amidotransferase